MARSTLLWDSFDASHEEYDLLPVDLTRRTWTHPAACWRSANGTFRGRWLCTRLVGHTGRHAAGDGDRIRAVWP